MSALASDLALTNLTETVGFSAKRSARQLWGGARASIAFCYRGLRITLGDVIESVSLLGRILSHLTPPLPLHPLHPPPQTPPLTPHLHSTPAKAKLKLNTIAPQFVNMLKYNKKRTRNNWF